MRVSKVKITEEAKEKFQSYREAFSDIEHQKRFFSAIKQILAEKGWDVDIKRNPAAVMAAALQSEVNLLRVFLEQKYNLSIPQGRTKTIPKIKDVMTVNDIQEDDRILFSLVKAMVAEAQMTTERRQLFYKRAHRWLKGRGWEVPKDFSFGILIVTAIDRQCLEEDRDPVTLFYGSIQKVLEER